MAALSLHHRALSKQNLSTCGRENELAKVYILRSCPCPAQLEVVVDDEMREDRLQEDCGKKATRTGES